MSMNIIRKITHEEVMMLHMLGILPRHIFGLAGHPLLDQALKLGKLYKTLRLLLPQYGFTPGYPEVLLARAQRILSAQRNAGVGTISCFDVDYPKSLMEICDFPPLIHYLGDSSLFSKLNQVAVVGARNADRQGCEAAWKLGYEFGKDHIVVSGLAAGCDTAAHRGCLEAGGRTVAVVATGLDTVFPHENEDLQKDILRSGGAVLSEQLFGAEAKPKYLVARNRLQAALANTVIVAQCPERSGTLHTVKFAQRYHKDVKAWRFTVRNEANAGNFALIGSGVASSIVLE